ncbi:MAG TPA: sugar phosphate isomerase/epimerase [Pseudonocardiaceae bacterium]
MTAAPVALSTASVWPEPAERAFRLAAELGYDGVEVMVWTDPVSQDLGRLTRLSARYGVPVLAVHAPCLLITQRVWGSDPVRKLHRSAEAACDLGAGTVVIHPPFRWQRRYALAFQDEVLAAESRTGVRVAVENMFPFRRAGLAVSAFHPSPDPTDVGYPHYTLDLSHTAASGQDALELVARMGSGLTHVHLTDGTGLPHDEHLVPGRGTQPVAEVCETLTRTGFDGTVVVEISTRHARTRAARDSAVAESLAFARLHLTPVP